MRSFGWSVIQCDLCSYERILGASTHGRNILCRLKMAISKAKSPSEETQSGYRLGPLTSEYEKANLFKLLSLQYFVMESPNNLLQTHCLFKSVFSFHMSFFELSSFLSIVLSSLWSEEILCINSIFFFCSWLYFFLIF